MPIWIMIDEHQIDRVKTHTGIKIDDTLTRHSFNDQILKKVLGGLAVLKWAKALVPLDILIKN